VIPAHAATIARTMPHLPPPTPPRHPPAGVPRWLWPPPGATVRSVVVREEAAPGAPAWRSLPEALPERVRVALAGAAGIAADARAGGLSRERRHALVQVLKRLELPVAGTRGYDHAEVTAGGVALSEVDPGTMASRVVPGLFVAGEVLDLDGPIGGFSFQAAFATGELAGRAL